jgi:hypothetical protein
MSKTRGSQEPSVLRNSTIDEGGPLEPACRSWTQTTIRCCALTGVVVSGEGKGPGARPGSGDFQEGPQGTTDFVSKRVRDVKTRVVRRFWDELRRHLLYARSGIRHTGGLSLAEAIVGNMGSSESM